MSKNNIVKRTLDLTKPPAVTDEQKARLSALAEMPNSHIDTRDIPPLPDAGWYKPVEIPHTKRQITLRISACAPTERLRR
jgi:uncharacterized protein (DUF4415 family)